MGRSRKKVPFFKVVEMPWGELTPAAMTLLVSFAIDF
jgi:hypothetical protein